MLKIKVFKSICIPILLYGCETWTISKKQQKTINAYSTTCYRIILQISKLERVKNEEILKKVDARPLYSIIKERQLKFPGQNFAPVKILIKQQGCALCVPAIGKSKKGKPPLNYVKQIEKLTGKKSIELTNVARENSKWLQLISGIT